MEIRDELIQIQKFINDYLNNNEINFKDYSNKIYDEYGFEYECRYGYPTIIKTTSNSYTCDYHKVANMSINDTRSIGIKRVLFRIKMSWPGSISLYTIFDDAFQVKYNLIYDRKTKDIDSIIETDVKFKFDKCIWVFDNKNRLIETYDISGNRLSNDGLDDIRCTALSNKAIPVTFFYKLDDETDDILCITKLTDLFGTDSLPSINSVLSVQIEPEYLCARLYGDIKSRTVTTEEAHKLLVDYNNKYKNKHRRTEYIDRQVEITKYLSDKLSRRLKAEKRKAQKDNNTSKKQHYSNNNGGISVTRIYDAYQEYKDSTDDI